MSNPGVILLAEKRLSDDMVFRVEDNLGEAIHLHYSKIRVDLSIKQFLYIADAVAESINILLNKTGFHLEDYDINFLNEFSWCFSNLLKVEKLAVCVDSLRLRSRNYFGLPVTKSIKQYNNANLIDGNFQDSTGSVVLFNDSPVIMSGEYTALKAYLGGEEENLTIIRFVFANNFYSVQKNPWKKYLFQWNKKRIYRLLKKVAKLFIR
jgi:hypothetical protein